MMENYHSIAIKMWFIYIYRCLMMENYHSIAKKCGLYIYRCLMMENYHSIAIKMWFKYIDV